MGTNSNNTRRRRRSLDKDKNQNVTYGDTLLENTKNSLVYADHKLVSVAGLDNIVVIETSDAILVIDRNQSQEVKMIVNNLAINYFIEL